MSTTEPTFADAERRNFAKHLDRLLSELAISQAEFSRMTSYNRSTVNLIINGRRLAGLEFMSRAAAALDVPLHTMILPVD